MYGRLGREWERERKCAQIYIQVCSRFCQIYRNRHSLPCILHDTLYFPSHIPTNLFMESIWPCQNIKIDKIEWFFIFPFAHSAFFSRFWFFFSSGCVAFIESCQGIAENGYSKIFSKQKSILSLPIDYNERRRKKGKSID